MTVQAGLPYMYSWVLLTILLTCGKQSYTAQVRLSNGPSPNTGLLEIYLEEQWLTICDQTLSITKNWPGVFCRELGFQTASDVAYCRDVESVSCYGSSSNMFRRAKTSCAEDAASVDDCTMTIADRGCRRDKSIVLTCQTASDAQQIRVVTQSSSTVDAQTDPPCLAPELHISGGGSRANESISSHRTHAVTLTGKMTLQCASATSSAFLWTVHLISGPQDEPSDQNKISFPANVNLAALDLNIPQFTLNYGTYIMKLKATLNTGSQNGDALISEALAWVSIIPTDLRAVIDGGSARTLGCEETIVLDARQSNDPDVSDPAASELQYVWFCRMEREEFPADYIIAEHDGAGCFGQGYKLGGEEAVISVNARSLSVNTTYIFRLWVKKMDRASVYTDQAVTIVPGEPPQIRITCLINCGSSVNPAEKLAMHLECSNCHSSVTYAYRWSVRAEGSSDSAIVWDVHSTTGRDKKNLVVKANVFPADKQRSYLISVTVSDGFKSDGYAEYTFRTNSAPSSGSCTVTPTRGRALQTEFSVNCVGFSDPDQPLMYEFSTVDTDNSKSVFAYGSESHVESVLLPQGRQDQDFSVSLHVHVTDELGASTETHLSVQVEKTELVVSDLKSLTEGGDSALSQLHLAGDTQAATQLISSITSVLNADADTSNDQAAKQERRELRTVLVENLAQTEVKSVEALQQTSAAIAMVTEHTAELDFTAQRSAASAIQTMSEFLSQQASSAATSSQKVQESARMIVAGISNVITAAVADASIGDDTSTPTTEAQSKNVTAATLNALESLKAALLVSKVTGESASTVTTDSLTMSVNRQSPESLSSAPLTVDDGTAPVTYFAFPASFNVSQMAGAQLESVDTEVVKFKNNPFTWASSSDRVNSHVSQLVLRSNNSALKVANLTQPIDIYIPVHQSACATIKVRSAEMSRIDFNVTRNSSSTLLLMNTSAIWRQTQAYPEVITVVMRLREKPTFQNYSYATNINVSDILKNPKGHSMQIPASLLEEMGASLHIGLFLNSSYQETVGQEALEFSVTTLTSQCLFWDEESELWTDEGCQLGPDTSISTVHCRCTHLTSFASEWLVMPNTINFAEDLAKFLTFWTNPTVIIFVTTVFIAYVVIAVWARRQDKLDEQKAVTIVLADNDPDDSYSYHVIVLTGSRRRAGTTASVTITLCGENSNSNPHLLSDSKLEMCNRSSADSFIINTSQSLGELQAVRLWHDNTGRDPAWFVSRVFIKDLQTNQNWYIICNNWLAVDLGEFGPDQTFSVAQETDINQFSHLFKSKTTKGLADNHIWFSVFTRPAYSSFTRLQRLSCCLTLVMTKMLTSIMFFGAPTDPLEQQVDLGTVQFTWSDFIIGLESALISMPVNFLIVSLFRASRPIPFQCRKQKQERYLPMIHYPENCTYLQTAGNVESDNKAKQEGKIAENPTLGGVSESMLAYDEPPPYEAWTTFSSVADREYDTHIDSTDHIDVSQSSSSHQSDHSGLDHSDHTESDGTYCSLSQQSHEWVHINMIDLMAGVSSDEEATKMASKHTTEPAKLPAKEAASRWRWLLAVLSWLLVVLVSLTSAFFVMLYSMNYGHNRSRRWLLSWFTAFFSSMSVIQPLQIVAVAAFFSLVFKTEDTMEELNIGDIEDHTLGNAEDKDNSENYRDKLLKMREDVRYQPPPPVDLSAVRQVYRHRARMYALMREILGYVMFLWLLLLIAYNQRDVMSYHLNRSVSNIFTRNKPFRLISNYESLFFWLNETYLEALYDEDDAGFLVSKTEYLVGSPVLRQIRIAQDQCKPASIFTSFHCTASYSPHTINTQNFNESWQKVIFRDTQGHDGSLTDHQMAWVYRSSAELRGQDTRGTVHTYQGNGYVASLGITKQQAKEMLEYLMSNLWVDGSTAVLFAEAVTYNANINLFTVIKFIFEFPSFGGVFKSTKVNSMRLFKSTVSFHIFLTFCEVSYCVYTLYFIVVQILNIRQQGWRYFRGFWSIFEITIIIVSLTAIFLYVLRSVESDIAIANYKNGSSGFISIHTAMLVDTCLLYCLALLVLLGTIKFIHILRLNPKIYMLTTTLRRGAKDISINLTMFLLALLSSAVFLTLLFGREMVGYRDVGQSLVSLILAILGLYDMETLRLFHPFTGPFIILTFTFFANLVFLNILISVVLRYLKLVRENHEPNEDDEMFQLLIEHVRGWFGLKVK